LIIVAFWIVVCLGTHPGGRFGHVLAQFGPLIQEGESNTQSSNFHALAGAVPDRLQLFSAPTPNEVKVGTFGATTGTWPGLRPEARNPGQLGGSFAGPI
jgi:hypothetical protein